MKPFLLKPIPDYTIWGNGNLSKARNKDKNYGTWWEVSAHPYCSNEVINFKEHKTLQQYIDEDLEGILGKGYTLHECLRLAYLDAKEALSIQVHPEDEYALKHSNDYGKYESWYIIDAKPGATLVAGTTTNDISVIKQAIEDKTIEKYLKKWPVKKGDYITIPTGTLHALGADIWALEVGTNSNTTYRFYDYERKDVHGNTRQLHLKESFDVVNLNTKSHFEAARKQTRRIGDTPYFTVDEIYADKDIILKQNGHYCILSNIDQDTSIIWNHEEIHIPQYDSVFVPANANEVVLKKGSHVLYSQPVKG